MHDRLQAISGKSLPDFSFIRPKDKRSADSQLWSTSEYLPPAGSLIINSPVIRSYHNLPAHWGLQILMINYIYDFVQDCYVLLAYQIWGFQYLMPLHIWFLTRSLRFVSSFNT